MMKKSPKKDEHEAEPSPGGGALERLHQWENERGLEETEIGSEEAQPAEEDPSEAKREQNDDVAPRPRGTRKVM